MSGIGGDESKPGSLQQKQKEGYDEELILIGDDDEPIQSGAGSESSYPVGNGAVDFSFGGGNQLHLAHLQHSNTEPTAQHHNEYAHQEGNISTHEDIFNLSAQHDALFSQAESIYNPPESTPYQEGIYDQHDPQSSTTLNPLHHEPNQHSMDAHNSEELRYLPQSATDISYSAAVDQTNGVKIERTPENTTTEQQQQQQQQSSETLNAPDGSNTTTPQHAALRPTLNTGQGPNPFLSPPGMYMIPMDYASFEQFRVLLHKLQSSKTETHLAKMARQLHRGLDSSKQRAREYFRRSPSNQSSHQPPSHSSSAKTNEPNQQFRRNFADFSQRPDDAHDESEGRPVKMARHIHSQPPKLESSTSVIDLSSGDDEEDTPQSRPGDAVRSVLNSSNFEEEDELTDLEDEAETKIYTISIRINRTPSFTGVCGARDHVKLVPEQGQRGEVILKAYRAGHEEMGFMSNVLVPKLCYILRSPVVNTDCFVAAPSTRDMFWIDISIDVWCMVASIEEVKQMVASSLPPSMVHSWLDSSVGMPLSKKAIKPIPISGVSVPSSLQGQSTDFELLFSSVKQIKHESMKMAEPPRFLKTMLFPHQLQAIQWMKDQEDDNLLAPGQPPRFFWKVKENRGELSFENCLNGIVTRKKPLLPKGGILADDMGLGKTLTVLSLILSNRLELIEAAGKSESAGPSVGPMYRPGSPTLIICPVSVMSNWDDQITRHVDQHNELLKVLIYYGTGRQTTVESMMNHDIVITTYATLQKEFNFGNEKRGSKEEDVDIRLEQNSPLFQINWHRIVLDEAHTIRTRTTKQARAVFQLQSERRWCLTGTPIQNSLDDLYSLLCFLRVEPLSDRLFWSRLVGKNLRDSSKKAIEVLKHVASVLCLRRTKEQQLFGKPILDLPPKTISAEIINNIDCVRYVEFSPEEYLIYQRTFATGKKIYDSYVANGTVLENISHILVLLLRIRQVCDHLSLLPENVQGIFNSDDTRAAVAKLQETMSSTECNKEDECYLCMIPGNEKMITSCNHVFCQMCYERIKSQPGHTNCPYCRRQLRDEDVIPKSDAVKMTMVDFTAVTPSYRSTKMRVICEILANRPSGQKTVIFSQWTSMLRLIEFSLREEQLQFEKLDGSMDATKRAASIRSFESSSTVSVFLISLTAGGVGLNLTSASQVIIVDPWWNPATEAQAIDRVHRMGQTKPVDVVRLIIKDSIEDRILSIQKDKSHAMIAAFGSKSQQETQRQRIEGLRFLFTE